MYWVCADLVGDCFGIMGFRTSVACKTAAPAIVHGSALRSPRLDIEDRIADKADDRLQRLRKVMAETDKKARRVSSWFRIRGTL